MDARCPTQTHTWTFELDGEAVDKLALKPLAPACNCTILPGPDARPWLGGPKFVGVTREQAQADAKKALALLNGLARLKNPNHRNVDLGDAVLRDKSFEYMKPPSGHSPKSEIYEYSSPLTGPLVEPAVDPTDQRMLADPRLAEIVEVFADHISWQRLRVAFEKIAALVGKGDNALVKHGYASQAELTRFKANAQDPRHSGVNAVHGVPQGPLKGTKMTEEEGFAFVVRLFNTFVKKHAAAKKPKADELPKAQPAKFSPLLYSMLCALIAIGFIALLVLVRH